MKDLEELRKHTRVFDVKNIILSIWGGDTYISVDGNVKEINNFVDCMSIVGLGEGKTAYDGYVSMYISGKRLKVYTDVVVYWDEERDEKGYYFLTPKGFLFEGDEGYDTF